MTRFSNDAGTGYVDADGFKGAASAADVAAGRGSTTAANFPNGLSTSATGTISNTPVNVVASGSNSQSGATLLTGAVTIVITVTATTRAVRIPKTPNTLWRIYNDTATAVKVYPSTNATIAALSTNTNTTIAARKASDFFVRSATHVVTFVGA